MATGLTYDSRDALRRLDFYWSIDNLKNLTYSTISIPAIAIQLYDPSFTTWNPETIGNSPTEVCTSQVQKAHSLLFIYLL